MKEVFDDCMRLLAAGADDFPWSKRHAYADWLAQTFHYVSHSTRLLAAACARFPLDARGAALHQRFAKHMAEEDRHELLAKHDIESLGLSLEQFEERDATRMFYEPQYYKIEHQDPLALFGYILPLEAVAVAQGPRVLAKVEPLFGRASTTFLRVHAGDDVEHLEQAFAALVGISAQQEQLIRANLRQSTTAYLGILRALIAQYGSSSGREAA